MLADIRDEAEGLDEMVRNLLAMTRIDAGALEVRRDWVDLREIVERAADAARRRGAKHSIEVRLPPDLPMVRADAKLVEQALGNVVANAVAHTPAETQHRHRCRGDAGARYSCASPTTAPASPPTCCRTCSRNSCTRSADGAGAATAAKAPAWGSPSPRASWMRTAGTIDALSPVAKRRGTRVTLTFPREEASP